MKKIYFMTLPLFLAGCGTPYESAIYSICSTVLECEGTPIDDRDTCSDGFNELWESYDAVGCSAEIEAAWICNVESGFSCEQDNLPIDCAAEADAGNACAEAARLRGDETGDIPILIAD